MITIKESMSVLPPESMDRITESIISGTPCGFDHRKDLVNKLLMFIKPYPSESNALKHRKAIQNYDKKCLFDHVFVEISILSEDGSELDQDSDDESDDESHENVIYTVTHKDKSRLSWLKGFLNRYLDLIRQHLTNQRSFRLIKDVTYISRLLSDIGYIRVEEDLNSATDTTKVLQVYFLNRRNCLNTLVSLIAGFDVPPHNSFRYFLTQNNYTVEYISNQLQESRDIDFDDLKSIRRTSQGWYGFKSNGEELFHIPITWFVSRYDLIIDNESYDVENVDGINFTITLSKIPTDQINKLSRYRFKSDLIICRLFISG